VVGRGLVMGNREPTGTRVRRKGTETSPIARFRGPKESLRIDNRDGGIRKRKVQAKVGWTNLK